jgi:hypothetical protein
VFDIGSVSKQFTATAVLLLAAEDRLSVECVSRPPVLLSWSFPVAALLSLDVCGRPPCG